MKQSRQLLSPSFDEHHTPARIVHHSELGQGTDACHVPCWLRTRAPESEHVSFHGFILSRQPLAFKRRPEAQRARGLKQSFDDRVAAGLVVGQL